MTKRLVLAGLAGGVAMFVWTSVAHLLLPLGETGVKEMPNEQAVLTSMQASIGQASGFYYFPGMGIGPDATSEQKRAAMQHYDQKTAVSPSGILIYTPPPSKSMTPGRLGTELCNEFLQALLLAFLIAQTKLVSFGSKVGFATVVGVLAALPTNVSYWNWYGFPTNYTVAYMAIQIFGFLCAGLAIAPIMKRAA